MQRHTAPIFCIRFCILLCRFSVSHLVAKSEKAAQKWAAFIGQKMKKALKIKAFKKAEKGT